MAHYQQLEFIKILRDFLPSYFKDTDVLEVGSWDTNGSIRSLFHNAQYIGADVAPGPGVDIVSPGEELSFTDKRFDITISCECFEHNKAWAKTFNNMYRMLKPHGLLVVTCATLGRSEHGTKRTNKDASLTALNDFPDYYKNLSTNDFKKNFDLASMFCDFKFYLNPFSKDLYFVGRKHGLFIEKFPKEICKAVQGIKYAKPKSFLSELRYRLRFYFRYFFAALVGEKLYHEIRHRINARHLA